MRPPLVVVPGILSETPRRCRSPKISTRSVSSILTVNTKRSAKQFALGQRGGILTTSIPHPPAPRRTMPRIGRPDRVPGTGNRQRARRAPSRGCGPVGWSRIRQAGRSRPEHAGSGRRPRARTGRRPTAIKIGQLPLIWSSLAIIGDVSLFGFRPQFRWVALGPDRLRNDSFILVLWSKALRSSARCGWRHTQRSDLHLPHLPWPISAAAPSSRCSRPSRPITSVRTTTRLTTGSSTAPGR
jgi:hypothetical protein